MATIYDNPPRAIHNKLGKTPKDFVDHSLCFNSSLISMELHAKTSPGSLPCPADAVRRLPPLLRFAALRDTIDLCSDAELEPILLLLLELASTACLSNQNTIKPPGARLVRLLREPREREARRAALAAQRLLLANWHRLTGPSRGLARAIPGVDWLALAAETIRTGPNAAPGVLAFAETAGPATLLPDLAPLLAHPDRRTADHAERLLIRAALRSIPTPLPDRPASLASVEPGLGPGPLPPLVEALAVALDTHASHERSGPILAALLLLDRPAGTPGWSDLEPIRARLGEARHPAFATARRLLRRDEAPAMRRLAWRLLTPGPLAMAALERVARAASTAEHEALLAHAHLILNPRRAGLTAHLVTASGKNDRASPLPTSPARLSTTARRGLAVLLPHLNADPDLRARLHVEALVDPDERTRLAHARRAGGPELSDFCLDPSPEIAAFAARRWSLAGVGDTRHLAAPPPTHARLAAALDRSPHAAVRAIAAEEPGAPSPRGVTARLHALARRDHDRRALADQWLDAARSGAPADRVAAIVNARRYQLLAGWHDPLAELLIPDVSEGAARVAATAASALGDLPGEVPPAALESAFRHPDPRVRANAIESAERLAHRAQAPTGLHDRLLEFKTSAAHRARANALRALARRDDPRRPALDPVAEELDRLLTDDRVTHRLAGVWLAERLLCLNTNPARDPTWQRLTRRVAQVARNEADPHIKERARRCSRRLLAELSRPVALNAPRPAAEDPALGRARERFAQFARAGGDA